MMNTLPKLLAFSLILATTSTASFADFYVWEGTSNEPTVTKEADILIYKEKYQGYTIVEIPEGEDGKTYLVSQIAPSAKTYTFDTIEPSKNYIIYKK